MVRIIVSVQLKVRWPLAGKWPYPYHERMRDAASKHMEVLAAVAPIAPISDEKSDLLSRVDHPILDIDPKAEAKLRLKLDLYVLPTVALLYLFCFIDRANIGPSPLPLSKSIYKTFILTSMSPQATLDSPDSKRI